MYRRGKLIKVTEHQEDVPFGMAFEGCVIDEIGSRKRGMSSRGGQAKMQRRGTTCGLYCSRIEFKG